MATDDVSDGAQVPETPRHFSNTREAAHSQGNDMVCASTVHYFSKHDTIKLSSHNFLLWKHQLLLILEGYGLEGFVLGTISSPPAFVVNPDGQQVKNPAFVFHRKQDKFLASWLLSTVTDDILIHLTNAKTSCAIWNTIEKRFSAKSSLKISSMSHALYSLKKINLSVKDYVAKVKQLSDDLTAAGSPISEQGQISVILAGLSVDFESVRVFASVTPLSLDLLTEMLLDCESRQLELSTEVSCLENLVTRQFDSEAVLKQSSEPSNYSQGSKQTYRGQGRGFSRGRSRGNGRGWSRSKLRYQLCGKVGHLVQTCFHRFDENFLGVAASDTV